jgi:uncharacterized phiE125 gp8 family phage protein
MGLSLVTGPALEPVSLIEAKQHCRVDSTDDDGLIAGYILSARSWAEDLTRRAFTTQTWDYTIDSDWPRMRVGYCDVYRIELPKPKLISVSSVSYVDTNGASQTLATDQYTVNATGITGLIDPAYGVTWPQVRDQMNAITVRFVCGFGPNPGDGQELERVRAGILQYTRFLLDGNKEDHDSAVNLIYPLRVLY